MRKLYESVDKSKLYFEYVGPTKEERFYEYMDSAELFMKLKYNLIRFSEAKKEARVVEENKWSKNG